MSEPLSILVVDDDAIFRNRIVEAFRNRGHWAEGLHEDETAEQLLARDPRVDLCFVDLRMPIHGLEWIPTLRRLLGKDGVLIVLTGYGSIATAVQAVRLGADDYLTKPADLDQLLAAYDRAQAGDDGETGSEYPVASLDRLEWEHIQRILRECEGNVTQAARKLGLHRQSLQRKLRSPPP